jgi:hypothetical protein
MKVILITITAFLMSAITHSQEFKFETETINYGKITQGSEGVRVFQFTNTGNEPLIIKDVKTTCGCAVPKKPLKPIMPGEKGEIEVSYNTKRLGGFSKAITVFSNAKKARVLLKLKGYVYKS